MLLYKLIKMTISTDKKKHPFVLKIFLFVTILVCFTECVDHQTNAGEPFGQFEDFNLFDKDTFSNVLIGIVGFATIGFLLNKLVTFWNSNDYKRIQKELELEKIKENKLLEQNIVQNPDIIAKNTILKELKTKSKLEFINELNEEKKILEDKQVVNNQLLKSFELKNSNPEKPHVYTYSELDYEDNVFENYKSINERLDLINNMLSKINESK